MENDLITRHTALAILRALKEAVYNSGSASDVEDAINMIQNVKAIDAEPVRHGRWIWSGGCIYVCSVCHNYALESSGKNYCPNCGAKMDAEAER